MLTDMSVLARSWVDVMEEQASAQVTPYLRLSAAEWMEERRRMLIGWQGDLRDLITLTQRVEAAREVAARETEAPVRAAPATEFDGDFALWREMIENPAQYDGDLVEVWLPLDEKLSTGAGRWRLGAYWLKKDEEEAAAEERRLKNATEVKEKQAATVIQAAVRGHLTRSGQDFRDCCMCLAHAICPFRTDVGLICRECQEQGPYVDITGPLSDPWAEFRGDTEPCTPPRVIRTRKA